MDVGENNDGNNYQFYGGQVAISVAPAGREGTYRLVASTTTNDFFDPVGERSDSLQALTFSADQMLSDHIGAFVRIGWLDTDALVPYEAMYTAGFDLKGTLWGRDGDNIGIGFA